MGLPRAELIDLFTDLSDLPVVLWAGDPVPMSAVVVVLAEFSNIPLGGDIEIIREFDSVKNLNKETTVNRRKVTLSVTVRDLTALSFPSDVATKIALRLGRQSTKDRLQALNLAVLKVHEIGDVGATEPLQVRTAGSRADTRALRQASLDIVFAYLESEVDDSAGGGWIETVDSGGPVPGTLA